MQSSQVRNVSLPSTADSKRDVPAWTQDPKIFPLDWFSVSRPNIIRQTKEYVSKLSKWRNCPKIKTLSKLKAVLKRIMMFLHTHISYIDGKSLLECDLEEDLITLVSIYMDMELRVLLIKKSATSGPTTLPGPGPATDADTARNDKLVSDRISYWLYTMLSGHDQRLDALLSTTVFTRHTRPVLDPIFRKVLSEMSDGPFSNVNYVRHMLAYKTWRERTLVVDDSASLELNSRVLQQLVPRDYAFPPPLLRCLGKGDNAREHARPHNINLADACRNFMRYCREIPAAAVEQINFESIPLFDDDLLGDEEGEVNKIMNMISNRKQRKSASTSPRRSNHQVDVFIDLTVPKSRTSPTPTLDVIDLTEEDEKPVITSRATALERSAPSPLRIAPAVRETSIPQTSPDCYHALVPSSQSEDLIIPRHDQDLYLFNICICPVRAYRQTGCKCKDKNLYQKNKEALKMPHGRCFQFSNYLYPSEDDVDTEMPLVFGNSQDPMNLDIRSSTTVKCNRKDESRDKPKFSDSFNNCDCDECKDNLSNSRTCGSAEISDNVQFRQNSLVTYSQTSTVAEMYGMEKAKPIKLYPQTSTQFSGDENKVQYFSETLDKRKVLSPNKDSLNNNSRNEIPKIKLPTVPSDTITSLSDSSLKTQESTNVSFEEITTNSEPQNLSEMEDVSRQSFDTVTDEIFDLSEPNAQRERQLSDTRDEIEQLCSEIADLTSSNLDTCTDFLQIPPDSVTEISCNTSEKCVPDVTLREDNFSAKSNEENSVLPSVQSDSQLEIDSCVTEESFEIQTLPQKEVSSVEETSSQTGQNCQENEELSSKDESDERTNYTQIPELSPNLTNKIDEKSSTQESNIEESVVHNLLPNEDLYLENKNNQNLVELNEEQMLFLDNKKSTPFQNEIIPSTEIETNAVSANEEIIEESVGYAPEENCDKLNDQQISFLGDRNSTSFQDEYTHSTEMESNIVSANEEIIEEPVGYVLEENCDKLKDQQIPFLGDTNSTPFQDEYTPSTEIETNIVSTNEEIIEEPVDYVLEENCDKLKEQQIPFLGDTNSTLFQDEYTPSTEMESNIISANEETIIEEPVNYISEENCDKLKDPQIPFLSDTNSTSFQDESMSSTEIETNIVSANEEIIEEPIGYVLEENCDKLKDQQIPFPGDTNSTSFQDCTPSTEMESNIVSANEETIIEEPASYVLEENCDKLKHQQIPFLEDRNSSSFQDEYTPSSEMESNTVSANEETLIDESVSYVLEENCDKLKDQQIPFLGDPNSTSFQEYMPSTEMESNIVSANQETIIEEPVSYILEETGDKLKDYSDIPEVIESLQKADEKTVPTEETNEEKTLREEKVIEDNFFPGCPNSTDLQTGETVPTEETYAEEPIREERNEDEHIFHSSTPAVEMVIESEVVVNSEVVVESDMNAASTQEIVYNEIEKTTSESEINNEVCSDTFESEPTNHSSESAGNHSSSEITVESEITVSHETDTTYDQTSSEFLTDTKISGEIETTNQQIISESIIEQSSSEVDSEITVSTQEIKATDHQKSSEFDTENDENKTSQQIGSDSVIAEIDEQINSENVTSNITNEKSQTTKRKRRKSVNTDVEEQIVHVEKDIPEMSPSKRKRTISVDINKVEENIDIALQDNVILKVEDIVPVVPCNQSIETRTEQEKIDERPSLSEESKPISVDDKRKRRRKQNLKNSVRDEKKESSKTDNSVKKELVVVCEKLSANDVEIMTKTNQTSVENNLKVKENKTRPVSRRKIQSSIPTNKDIENTITQEMKEENELNKINLNTEKIINKSVDIPSFSEYISKEKEKQIKFRGRSRRKKLDNNENTNKPLENQINASNFSELTENKVKRPRGRPPKNNFFSENLNKQNVNSKNKNEPTNDTTQNCRVLSDEDIPLAVRISQSPKRNSVKIEKNLTSDLENNFTEEDLPLIERRKLKSKPIKTYSKVKLNKKEENLSDDQIENEIKSKPSFRDKLKMFKFKARPKTDDNLENKVETSNKTMKNSKRKLSTFNNSRSNENEVLFPIPDIISSSFIKPKKSVRFSNKLDFFILDNTDHEEIKSKTTESNEDMTEKNSEREIFRVKRNKMKKFREIRRNIEIENEDLISGDKSNEFEQEKSHFNKSKINGDLTKTKLNNPKGINNFSCEEIIPETDNSRLSPKKLFSKRAREKLEKQAAKEVAQKIDSKSDENIHSYDKQVSNCLHQLVEEKIVENENKFLSEIPVCNYEEHHPVVAEETVVTSTELPDTIKFSENEINHSKDEKEISKTMKFPTKRTRKSKFPKLKLNGKSNFLPVKLNKNVKTSPTLKNRKKKKFRTKLNGNNNNKNIEKIQTEELLNKNFESDSKYSKNTDQIYLHKSEEKDTLKIEEFSDKPENKETESHTIEIKNLEAQPEELIIDKTDIENNLSSYDKNNDQIDTATNKIEEETVQRDELPEKENEETKSEQLPEVLSDKVNTPNNLINEEEKNTPEEEIREILTDNANIIESPKIDKKTEDVLYKPCNKIYEKQFDFYSDHDDVSNSELIIDTSAESSEYEDTGVENKDEEIQKEVVSPKRKYHHLIEEIVNLNENIEKSVPTNFENVFSTENPKEEETAVETFNYSDISDEPLQSDQTKMEESFQKTEECIATDLSVSATDHSEIIDMTAEHLNMEQEKKEIVEYFAEIAELLPDEIYNEFHSETLNEEKSDLFLVPYAPSVEMNMKIEIGFESYTIFDKKPLEEEFAKKACVKCSVNGIHKNNRKITLQGTHLYEENKQEEETLENCVTIPPISYFQAIETVEPNSCTLTANVASVKISTNDSSPVLDNYNLFFLADIAMNSVHLTTKVECNTSKEPSTCNQNSVDSHDKCILVTFPDNLTPTNKATTSVSVIRDKSKEMSVGVQTLVENIPPKGIALENKIQALTERVKSKKNNGENLDELYTSLENICETEMNTLAKGVESQPSGPITTNTSLETPKITEPSIPIDIPNTALLTLTPDDDILIRNVPFTLQSPPPQTSLPISETVVQSEPNLDSTGIVKDILKVVDSAEPLKPVTENNDHKPVAEKQQKTKSKKAKSKTKSSNQNSDANYLLHVYKSNQDSNKHSDVSNQQNVSNKNTPSPPSYIRSSRPMRMVTTKRNSSILDNNPQDEPPKKVSASEKMFDLLLEEHRKELSEAKLKCPEKNAESTNETTLEEHREEAKLNFAEKNESTLNEQCKELSEAKLKSPERNAEITNEPTLKEPLKELPEVKLISPDKNAETINEPSLKEYCKDLSEEKLKSPEQNTEITNEPTLEHHKELSKAKLKSPQINAETTEVLPEEKLNSQEKIAETINEPTLDEQCKELSETKLKSPETNVETTNDTLSIVDNIQKEVVTSNPPLNEEPIIPLSVLQFEPETESPKINKEETETVTIPEPEVEAKLENDKEKQTEGDNTTKEVSSDWNAIEVVQDWFNRVEDKSQVEPYTEITSYQTIEECNFFEEMSDTSENSPNSRKTDDKIFSEHQTPDSGIAFDEDSVQKDKPVAENLSDGEPVATKFYEFEESMSGSIHEKVIVPEQLKVSIALERIQEILPHLKKCKVMSSAQKSRKRKEHNDNEKAKRRKYEEQHDSVVEECVTVSDNKEVKSPAPKDLGSVSVRTKGSVKEYPDLFGITESPVPSGSFHSPYPSDISLTEEPTFYEEGGIDLCNDYPCYDSFEVLQEQQSLQKEYNVVDDNPKDVQQGLQAGYCVVDSQFLPLSEYMNDGDYILIDNKIFNDKKMVPVNMHLVQPETKPHKTEETKKSEFDDSEKEDSLSDTVDEILKNPNLFPEQSTSEVQVINMDQATSELQVVIACGTYQETDMSDTYLFGIAVQSEVTNNTTEQEVPPPHHSPMTIEELPPENKVIDNSEFKPTTSIEGSESTQICNTTILPASDVPQPESMDLLTTVPTTIVTDKILDNKDKLPENNIEKKKLDVVESNYKSKSEPERYKIQKIIPRRTSVSEIHVSSSSKQPVVSLPPLHSSSNHDSSKMFQKTYSKSHNLSLEHNTSSSIDKNHAQHKLLKQNEYQRSLNSVQKHPKVNDSSSSHYSSSLNKKSIDLKTNPKPYYEKTSVEDAFDRLKHDKTDIPPPPDNRRFYSHSSSDPNFIKSIHRKDIPSGDYYRRYSIERDSSKTRHTSQSFSDSRRSHSAYTEPNPKPIYRLPASDPSYRNSHHNYRKPEVKRPELRHPRPGSSSEKDWLKNETLLKLIKESNTIYSKKY